MGKQLFRVATISAIASLSSLASATVLTFDDLSHDTSEVLNVPVNYGGLDWSAAGWSVFGLEQAPYTPASGDWRAVTQWGADDAASTIRFNAPSIFEGAWFSGLDGATVTFQMYLGNTLVATSSTLNPSAAPAFLSSGYAGQIDRLVISSPEHASFAMDDFTFSAAVPEPQTYALLLAGIGALGLLARRRA
jgi:hypothetical protein